MSFDEEKLLFVNFKMSMLFKDFYELYVDICSTNLGAL
jgi:hypothetical protein